MVMRDLTMAWKCSGTELWSHHSMKLLKPRHRRRLLARPCCSCHYHSQTLAGTAGTGSAPGHWAWTSAQSRARGESAPRPPKPVTHAQWFPGNLLSLAFLPSLVTLETRAGCSVLPMFPTLPKGGTPWPFSSSASMTWEVIRNTCVGVTKSEILGWPSLPQWDPRTWWTKVLPLEAKPIQEPFLFLKIFLLRPSWVGKREHKLFFPVLMCLSQASILFFHQLYSFLRWSRSAILSLSPSGPPWRRLSATSA